MYFLLLLYDRIVSSSNNIRVKSLVFDIICTIWFDIVMILDRESLTVYRNIRRRICIICKIIVCKYMHTMYVLNSTMACFWLLIRLKVNQTYNKSGFEGLQGSITEYSTSTFPSPFLFMVREILLNVRGHTSYFFRWKSFCLWYNT